jgi:hypothetical protein
MDEIKQLAELIKQRNRIAHEITKITNRPAFIGHIGEYIASVVFDIQLEESASSKAIDGFFKSGPLVGKSVNIKWYSKQDNLLAVTESGNLDYYLVMTGPKSPAESSKGKVQPWEISFVYLFDEHELSRYLIENNRKFGPAVSIRKSLWEAAEIFPTENKKLYPISSKQRNLLDLFN